MLSMTIDLIQMSILVSTDTYLHISEVWNDWLLLGYENIVHILCPYIFINMWCVIIIKKIYLRIWWFFGLLLLRIFKFWNDVYILKIISFKRKKKYSTEGSKQLQYVYEIKENF